MLSVRLVPQIYQLPIPLGKYNFCSKAVSICTSQIVYGSLCVTVTLYIVWCGQRICCKLDFSKTTWILSYHRVLMFLWQVLWLFECLFYFYGVWIKNPSHSHVGRWFMDMPFDTTIKFIACKHIHALTCTYMWYTPHFHGDLVMS